MEPHAAIASWDGDRLTVRASCQMLKYNRNELADALGIKPENVRILAPYVGGGFGSKLGIAHDAVAASIAARAVGRPVALALSRRQVFETIMRRSESRQRVRLAADAEGRLTGIGHAALVSQLPGEKFSEPVTQATHFLYAAKNREIVHEIVRLNLTCAGSVRAPGEAIGMTVLETAIDELAIKAGIDPVELRKRNIPETDPEGDKPFSSHMLASALDRGAELFAGAGLGRVLGRELHRQRGLRRLRGDPQAPRRKARLRGAGPDAQGRPCRHRQPPRSAGGATGRRPDLGARRDRAGQDLQGCAPVDLRRVFRRGGCQ